MMVIKTLADTVEFMTSSNYKERFIAEYAQTQIRYNALVRILVKLHDGELEFEPDTPKEYLEAQAEHMLDYLGDLVCRAQIEGIELPEIGNGGE